MAATAEQTRVCFSVLAGLLVAACAAPAFTAARPKRLALQHVCRDLEISRDSGLWVIPLDGSRLRGLGRALGRATPVACDKARPSCYLEFPWFFPFADIVRGDVWLDAPPPDLAGDKPASLALARNGDEVDVSVEGPAHMHVVLRGNVHGWSRKASATRRRRGVGRKGSTSRSSLVVGEDARSASRSESTGGERPPAAF